MCSIPMYLSALYELTTAKILEVPIVLVQLKSGAQIPTIAQIKSQFRVLERAYQAKPILVFENRAIRRLDLLSKNGIAYIYFDQEIYLPFLLTKIAAKSKKQINQTPEKLSNWSQIILINQLVRGDLEGATVSEITTKYAAPSTPISRAIRDLEQHELCHTKQTGTRKVLRFEPKLVLWQKAFRRLEPPVVATANLKSLPNQLPSILSGTSALAQKTMLADSSCPTYAVERKVFNKLKVEPLEVEQSEHVVVEVWQRNPAMTQVDGCADPISIYLSFLYTPDERIAMARDEYLGAFGLTPINKEKL